MMSIKSLVNCRMPNWLIMIVCFMVSSCAIQFPQNQQGGRDSTKDSGPTSRVDVGAIPDAIPEPVVRTRAGNYSPYTVLGQTYTVLPESHGFVEEGIASWYGRKFHGRLTSNGEKFDMYAMTAAHKHLPIPTYVEVTNLENGLKAILRVNDRGPFHGDRVIDLSWAAAAKLGYADEGTARVRIVALDPDAPYSTLAARSNANSALTQPPKVELVPEEYILDAHSYYQVAFLSQKIGARVMADEVEAYTKFPVRIVEETTDKLTGYRLLIGPLLDRREANTLSLILELAGLSPGFITTFKN